MKRKKFTLFLVAVALLLTVYYFKFDKKDDSPDLNPVSSERYEDYLQERATILEERNNAISTLMEILALKNDTTNTMQDKLQAVNNIKSLSQLTETEITLENKLLESGFEDVLVHLDDNTLTIKILKDESDITEVAEIMIEAENYFETPEVIVKYVSKTK